jgi:hypothetical protein
MARSLQVIAREIRVDWVAQGKQFSAARPYMLAMQTMATLDDSYGLDNARSIVNYFLANAGTWKGEVARRVKAELKRMLDEHAKGA